MKKSWIKILLSLLLVLLACFAVFKFNSYETNAYGEDLENNVKLSEAILSNDQEKVKALINEVKVDLNIKDSEGKYPLEVAMVMENCEMVKLLLENGADPYMQTQNGKTIYSVIVNSNNKYLQELIKEYQSNDKKLQDKLSEAILSNDTKEILNLINEKAVDLNAKDSEGKYPLEVAMVMENCEMVELLLKNGADLSLKTNEGITIYKVIKNSGNNYLEKIIKEYK